jgi:hypothetical protein
MDGLIIAIGNFISGDRGGGGVIPPPGSDYIISELSLEFIVTENNEFTITE